MRYKIYDASGSVVRCEVGKLEYNGQFMGESSVTVPVDSREPIYFSVGDYILYRGEAFTLNNVPTAKNVGPKNSTCKAFQYDNIKFESYSSELSNADFNDFVGDEVTDMSFTAMPEFSFVAATIDDLVQRIQVNLDRYYKGDKKWTIRVSSEYVYDKEKNNLLITASNMTCWDAIALFNSKYGVNFIIRGRVVTVGTSGSIKDIVFKVGQHKGLYDLTRNSQQDQAIVTRLKAYGNTTNLNPRYYSLVGATVSAKVKDFRVQEKVGAYKLFFQFDLDNKTDLFDYISFTINGEKNVHDLSAKYNSGFYEVAVEDGEYSEVFMDIYQSDLRKTIGKTVIISKGARKDNITDLTHLSFDPNSKLPNNMNIANLMLPGFPTKTLSAWVEENKSKYDWLQKYINEGYTFSSEKYYPYINSKNIGTVGVRPHSEFFKQDDDTHKDIHPSLQNFQDDRNSVIAATRLDGGEIDDNGLFKDGQEVASIYIVIPDLGFEFSEVVINGTQPKIHFNSGYCGGRDYTVESWERDSATNHWKLKCNRVKDDSIGKYFPYKDAPIKGGDKFTITDVYMSDAYIEQASVELLKWSLKWIAKNDFSVLSYQLSPDDIFIKRHDDAIEDKSTTFYNTIKEGDILQISDEDLGVSGSITIDQIKITEEDGKLLPSYEITLKDTKTVGTVQKIQQQIDALTGGGGPGYSSSQISEIAYSTMRSHFLAKDREDIAAKLIRFLEGIKAGSDAITGVDKSGTEDTTVLGALRAALIYLTKTDAAATYLNKTTGAKQEVTGEVAFDSLITALAGVIAGKVTSGEVETDNLHSTNAKSGLEGSGYRMEMKDGKSYLDVDYLTTRMKAIFNELEIRKLSYVGGNIVLSAAGSKIMSVKETDDVGNEVAAGTGTTYVCQVMNDDGTMATTNSWKVGDLAKCQTFNIKDKASSNAANRFYWRKVVYVGDGVVSMSKSDCAANSDAPQAGDTIVQYGSAMEKSRQNILVLSTSREGATSPEMFFFSGINSYSTDGKDEIRISKALGNRFTGDFMMQSSGESVEKSINDAKLAADNAAASATKANNDIASMTSDNVLSAIEKQSLKKEWEEIQEEYAKNIEKAWLYAVVDTSQYTASYNNLCAYLSGLKLFDSLSESTAIVRQDFLANFVQYYNAREDILGSIASANSDYTKGIADSMVNLKTETRASLQKVNDKIEAKVDTDTFNNLQTKVETNATSISVQSGKIDSQSTTINNLTGRISAAEQKITPEAITSTVNAQSVRGSENMVIRSYQKYTASGERFLHAYKMNSPWVVGRTYTATMKASLSVSDSDYNLFYLYPNMSAEEYYLLKPIGGGCYRCTFTYGGAANIYTVGVYTLYGVAVECSTEWLMINEGNCATPYAPAAEDALSSGNVLIGGESCVVESKNITYNYKPIDIEKKKNDKGNLVSPIVPGDLYTLSIGELACTVSTMVSFVLYDLINNKALTEIISVEVGSGRKATFIIPETIPNGLDLNNVKLLMYAGVAGEDANMSSSAKRLMLERGSSTGWKKSHTDEVAETNSTIEQTASQIRSEVYSKTDTDGKFSTISQTDEKITISVGKYASNDNLLNYSALDTDDDLAHWDLVNATQKEIATVNEMSWAHVSGNGNFGISQNIKDKKSILNNKSVTVSATMMFTTDVSVEIKLGVYGSTPITTAKINFTANVPLRVAISGQYDSGTIPGIFVVQVNASGLYVTDFYVRNCKLCFGNETTYTKSLLDTGIDVTSGQIALKAKQTKFLTETGKTAAVIDEEGLKTVAVDTSLNNGNRAKVLIKNGLLSVFNNYGNKQIEFGVDASGMAVMKYLDDNGDTIFDLSPNGLTKYKNAAVAESWEECEVIVYYYNQHDFCYHPYPANGDFTGGNSSLAAKGYKIYHKCYRYTAARNADGTYIDKDKAKYDLCYLWDKSLADMYDGQDNLVNFYVVFAGNISQLMSIINGHLANSFSPFPNEFTEPKDIYTGVIRTGNPMSWQETDTAPYNFKYTTGSL